ncbi:hypothetical protein H5410_011026 [Solanum commersonii]|uniref:Uncharacterized protein n=1 Tax=Solanum commersonii TaxID=4109 RepID=A0A9J6AMD4_SOLCO|nr:hypothetical protein H5410_011026 [Solanum commersonii]
MNGNSLVESDVKYDVVAISPNNNLIKLVFKQSVDLASACIIQVFNGEYLNNYVMKFRQQRNY